MQAMENAVSRALRGGSQDDVLSEGFRLTLTRKDLQTLSNLNWLNDEVSARRYSSNLYYKIAGMMLIWPYFVLQY